MHSFESVIAAFPRKRLLVVGDIMLDRFIYGPVNRISPEAPVQVIRARRTENTLGGAGNVARNLAALGAACELLSVLGADSDAAVLAGLATDAGVVPHWIRRHDRVTTVKTRFVADLHNTHLLRSDSEDVRPVESDVERAALEIVANRLVDVDAVILSDYAKGLLTPRLIDGIVAAARAADKPVIADPKGFDFSRYTGVTVLSPNVQELGQATGRTLANEEGEIEEAALALIALTGCRLVLVTRSERGLMVVGAAGNLGAFPAAASKVVDVSGAGDTAVASFALAHVCGAEPGIAARLANAAAGIVVGKQSTASVTADEIRSFFLSRPTLDSRVEFFRDLPALQALVERWKDQGLVVGFTNGCFDLLHPGHISLLSQARAACDKLVVGINSDGSVRRLKGPARPVQNEQARATVLDALRHVDAVSIFDEDTPLSLIRALMPDLLVKGADYRLDQVVGAEEVIRGGGRVMLVDLVENTSTTRIVNRLQNGPAPSPIPTDRG